MEVKLRYFLQNDNISDYVVHQDGSSIDHH